MIFVETEGGEETIEVSEPVAKLATDEAVRRSLTDLTAPLSKEGITALEVREGERVIERVTKAESEAFAEAPTADRPLVADTREQSFEIVSLAFREENKWRLSDGNSTISVMIEDRDFLEQVNRSAISFSKHDVLRCRVRFEQVQTVSGLRTIYTVEKVLQHVPAARTLSLPFSGTAA